MKRIKMTKIASALLSVFMIISMLPSWSNVHAETRTVDIYIGSELRLEHGSIGMLLRTEDTPYQVDPTMFEYFRGEPREMHFVPATVIGPEGTSRTMEVGQEAHIVWEPDAGYYIYSGSARYSPIGGGDYVTFFQPGREGGDCIFNAPAEADYIQINAKFKPYSFNVSTDSSVKHGTISGTVTDAEGNERTFDGTACTDETVDLTFLAEEGYELRRDSVIVKTSENLEVPLSADYTLGKISFTMPFLPVTVYAVFQKPEESDHKVILDQVNNGEGNAVADKEWAYPGETVTVSLTPGGSSVYQPVSISAGSDLSGNPDGIVPEIGAEGQVTFTMPAEDVNVSYGFMNALREVSVGKENTLQNGSVKINGNETAAGESVQVTAGSEVNVEIIPSSGYKVKNTNILDLPAKDTPEDLQDLGDGSYRFTASPLTWEEYSDDAVGRSYDVSPAFTIDQSFAPQAELQLGTTALGNNPNDADSCPILWYGGREWFVVGYNGEGNAELAQASSGAVSLLQRYIHDGKKISEFEEIYNPSGNDKSVFSTSGNSHYKDSNIRPHLNKYLFGGEYQLFSEEETAAIRSRDLGSGINDRLWIMSSAEANALPQELRKIPWTAHWLRDREKVTLGGAEEWSVYFVGNLNGGISSTSFLNREYSIRPAFNLDMDSVLFTSDVEKGKDSGAVGPDALKDVGLNSGRELKVTLKDSAYGITVNKTEFEGGVFTVDYTVSKYGDNDYISAYIVNSDGVLTHYGRIASPGEAEGTLEVNVDGIYDDGDKLYLINEHCNGGTVTDLASEPVELIKPNYYDLTIHWTSIDGEDQVDPVTISDIKEGTNLYDAIYDAGYSTELQGSFFTKDGYALVSSGQFLPDTMDNYSSMSEMIQDMINARNVSITEDTVLYYPMTKIIDSAEITITPPYAGTSTVTTSQSVPWNGQTNPPEITVPDDAKYSPYLGENGDTLAAWWLDPADNNKGYTGEFENDNYYPFGFSLLADFGYKFAVDTNDITVINGEVINKTSYDNTEYLEGVARVKAALKTYSITIQDQTNGTVTADKNAAAAGETVTLTPQPGEGYTFNGVIYQKTDDPTEYEWAAFDEGSGNYTFEMPAYDVTVRLGTITRKSYSLDLVVTPEVDNVLSIYDDKSQWGYPVSVSYYSDSGYQVRSIYYKAEGDDAEYALTEDLSGGYSFTMPKANVTIYAQIEEMKYPVSVDFGAGHEEFVRDLFEGNDEYSVDGSKVTSQMPALDRFGDPTALSDALDKIMEYCNGKVTEPVDNNELFMYRFGLKTRSEYKDEEEFDLEQGECSQIKLNKEDNPTLYALWAEPAKATISVTAPECGTVLTKDIHRGVGRFSPVPELSISGNASIRDESFTFTNWLIENSAGYEEGDTLTLTGENTYSGTVFLNTGWGYYLPEDISNCITVEGATIKEFIKNNFNQIIFDVDVVHGEERTETVAPTCEEDGYVSHVCSKCAKELSRDAIEKLGHDWGEWTVTKEATVTSEGEEQRVCKNDPSHVEVRKTAKADPTATPTPTIAPTGAPTEAPTGTPTQAPTQAPTNAPTEAPAVSIKLNKEQATLVCGKSETLKATVTGSKSAVIWKSSDPKIAAVDKDGKITSKMAGKATITATCGNASASCEVTVLYKDVTNPKDFWFAPTNYLTAKGVVKGYDKQTNFKPGNKCTRAQMVTFIWRLQGEPAPKAKTCKFKDVKKTDYFFKACIWGNENHIVEGYKNGTFGPQIVCARKHAVTFLWRLAGKPAPSSKTNKFKDVKEKDYFYKATLWASEKGILAGYSDGTFRPDGDCLRRQMVTFLYKYDKFINSAKK